jgi:nitroreductase
MRDESLYQAILARRSARRYQAAPLDEGTLARVREIVTSVIPLCPENHFEASLHSLTGSEALIGALGAYGRIVSPPHYLAPWMQGKRHVLTDLGCRAEQIAVRLAAMGLGSCFIGNLGREAEVRTHFGLPPDARIGAFLIFGWPSQSLAGRAVNAVMRQATGATNKLAVDKILFVDDWRAPDSLPPELLPLLEAARCAPSAVDAQPWRFLWQGGRLHLFVKVNNLRYGGDKSDYRYYDGGICMGNVLLALQALGIEGRWVLYDGDEPEIPKHPDTLEPLAVLEIGGSRM